MSHNQLIKIYRYSNSGFDAVFQSHLREKSRITLNDLIKNCTTEHMTSLIRRSFVEPDAEFEYEGIFAFLQKPNIKNKNFYLNHLKNKQNILYSESFIESNAFCYIDDGIVYAKQNKMCIFEAFQKNIESIYIPKSQLISIQLN